MLREKNLSYEWKKEKPGHGFMLELFCSNLSKPISIERLNSSQCNWELWKKKKKGKEKEKGEREGVRGTKSAFYPIFIFSVANGYSFSWLNHSPIF